MPGMDVIEHPQNQENLQEFLKEQINVPTILSHSDPIWSVKQPDTPHRFTVDYRNLSTLPKLREHSGL